MPGEIDKLFVTIGSDIKGFLTGITTVKTETVGLQSTMAAVGSNMVKYITLPMLAVGGAAVASAMTVEKGLNQIIKITGDTSAATGSLGQTMRDIGATSGKSFEDIGTAVGMVHARTGLMESGLEDLTRTYLKLGKVTNTEYTQVIEQSTQAMNQWQIAAENQKGALDWLYKVTTETGVSYDTLSGSMTKNAAQLKGMGFSFNEASALIGQFEQQGVNTEMSLKSLSIAMKKMAKEGIKDAAGQFQALMNNIKNAPTMMDAMALSQEYLGRSSVELTTAIREGKMNLDDLMVALGESPASIDSAAAATRTLGEKFGMLKNQVILALEPLGRWIMDLASKYIVPAFQQVTGVMRTLGEWFGKMPNWAKIAAAAVGAVGVALWLLAAHPVVLAIGAIIAGMMLLKKAFESTNPTIMRVKEVLLGAWEKVKTVFINVGTAIYNWVKDHWDTIKNIAKTVWDGIVAVVTAAWDFIKNYIWPIVVAIADWIGRNWENIKAVAISVWNAIAAVVGFAWDAIKNYIWPIVEGIYNWIKDHWEGIKTTTEVIFAIIKGILEVAWFAIRDIIWPVVTAIWNFICEAWNAIASATNAVWDIIKGTLEIVWGVIVGLFHAVWDPFVAALKVIWDVVKGAWDAIWALLHGDLSAVWDAIKGTAEKIWNTIKGLVTGVWDGLKAAWGAAWRGAVGIVEGAVNAVITVINGFIKGLNAVSSVIDWLVPGVDWGNIPPIPKVSWAGGEGGIVTRPTIALLGERGREAVIPLTGPNAGKGVGGFSINGGTYNFYGVQDVPGFKAALAREAQLIKMGESVHG